MRAVLNVTPAGKILLTSALLLLLGACAMAPKYSASNDPFKALATKTQRPFGSAKLCLILTEDTHKTFAYLDGLRDNYFSTLGATSGFDSKRLVADVATTLQARFQEVAPITSRAEIAAQGCALAMDLDLKITIFPGIRKEGIADIQAAISDRTGAKIDLIAISAKRTGWNSIGEAATSAWDAAITDFGSKLDTSAPLLAFAAGTPATSASALSPTVEIAFWDSVKTSTNPADFQAYLKKYPDGSFESLARSRLAALGEPTPQRLKAPTQAASSKFDFGTYHALVIGIDNYRAVPPLKTAVHDARAVAALLQKEYGFQVTLLLDATRNQMLDAFDDLRRTLTEHDNLLIYYAGHGHLDTDSDRGFWLPVDAEANRRANWLSNADIADVVRGTRAKHVLVVADSCYAGTLTRSLTLQLSATDDLSRLAQKRARTALVSGGLEPVEDAGGGQHSVFAKAFLDALQANRGVVDMSQIFSSMRRQVLLNAQQTPQYSDIRQVGHEGGDFIFVRGK